MRSLVVVATIALVVVASIAVVVLAGVSPTFGHGERKVTIGSERVTAGPTGGSAEPVNTKNPGPHR